MVVTVRAAHEVPFHSQVSERVAVLLPPKRRSVPPSAAMATPLRGVGPVVARDVHVVPSHSHVSPSAPALPAPPKRTSLPPSVAMLAIQRAGGDVAGVFCVQVA